MTADEQKAAKLMRERCRQAAAAWLGSCKTERESELVNCICGDIEVLPVSPEGDGGER